MRIVRVIVILPTLSHAGYSMPYLFSYLPQTVLFFLQISCTESKTSDTSTEPVAFSQIETEVFSVSCGFSSCHSVGAGGLILTGEDDYNTLVNQPSYARPDETLVIPFDVENSYLWKKITGAENISGTIMAPNAGVSDHQKQLIHDWIAQGAPE